MLNRIKNISIFVVITFYVLQLCMLFSGALIEDLQEIRNKIQTSKTHLAEKISVSKSEWNLLDNKREVKINNIFYDVISSKNQLDRVTLTVVKDRHESHFRIAINTFLNKKIFPNSTKKKSYKINNYITILNNHNFKIENCLNFFRLKTFFCTDTKDTNKIVLSTYKPPC